MSSNKEVRENPGFQPAAATIALKCLSSEEERLTRHGINRQPDLGNQSVDLLYSAVADTEFSVNDIVDRKWLSPACGIQLLLRPICPGRVAGGNIDDHVGIEKDHSSGSPRRKRMNSSVVMPRSSVPRIA